MHINNCFVFVIYSFFYFVDRFTIEKGNKVSTFYNLEKSLNEHGIQKNVIHIYYLCKENLYPKMRRVLILGRKSYKIYFRLLP